MHCHRNSHLLGRPIDQDAAEEACARGFQRQRRAAAYELKALRPDLPPPQLAGPGGANLTPLAALGRSTKLRVDSILRRSRRGTTSTPINSGNAKPVRGDQR